MATEVPFNSLHNSLKDYFNTSKYSDLTVRCDVQEFKVHKLVLCGQSKYFSNICDGDWKEAADGVIELKEDDFRVVEAMLHFMYRFDYDGSGNDQGRVSPMLFNVQVYGIADKYGILALKSVAKEKFDKAVRTCWDMDDFAHVITEIYSSTPSTDRGLRDTVVDVALTDRGLRDTVVDVAHEHIRALLEKDDFRGVLEETAVLLRMSRNLWPKRQDLQLSESIDAQMVRISGKRCFLLRVRNIRFSPQVDLDNDCWEDDEDDEDDEDFGYGRLLCDLRSTPLHDAVPGQGPLVGAETY